MTLRRAGLLNTLAGVASSAANVFLVPPLLSVYGLPVYGVLSLLTSVSQYLNVLDLGLSSALVRYAVRVRSHSDSTYFVYRRAVVRFFVFAGLIVGGVAAGTASLWAAVFQIDHVKHLPLAVLSAATLTVVALLGNCYNSALVAELRYAHLGAYNLLRNIGPQVVTALVYRRMSDLGTALACGTSFSVLLLGAQVCVLRSQEPALAGTTGASRGSEFRRFVTDSAGFSTQYLLDAMVLPVLQSVVGTKFGPDATGMVDISRRLLFALRRVIDAAFAPLFARANQMIEGRDLRALRRLTLRSTILTLVLAVAYFAVLKAALPWILAAWLQDRAMGVQPIAEALLVGVTFTIPHIAMYHLLAASAQGRLVNSIGSAMSAVAVLGALIISLQSVGQVLHAYAVGTFLATVLTLAYGVWSTATMLTEPKRKPV